MSIAQWLLTGAIGYAFVDSLGRLAWKPPMTADVQRPTEEMTRTQRWKLKLWEKERTRRFYVTSVVTLLVLLAALYVILSRHYDDAAQKWAISAISMIAGYWLRSLPIGRGL